MIELQCTSMRLHGTAQQLHDDDGRNSRWWLAFHVHVAIRCLLTLHGHACIQLVSCIEPVSTFLIFSETDRYLLAYLLMPIIASFLLVSLAV